MVGFCDEEHFQGNLPAMGIAPRFIFITNNPLWRFTAPGYFGELQPSHFLCLSYLYQPGREEDM